MTTASSDVLDELYNAGLSEVFLEISLQAAQRSTKIVEEINMA
jgi:hypothetical protein